MSSYGMWLAASGMQWNEHRQAVLANNLANANTTGFKHDLAIASQRRVESQSSPEGLEFLHPVFDGMSGGLQVKRSYLDFQQGAIMETGRSLDVAIDGDGFFAVSNGDDIRYTRNGAFAMNTDGELMLSADEGRWRVLSTDGEPIRLDRQSIERIRVSPDGTLRQGTNTVARIGLMTTDDKQSLRKVGKTLFDAGKMEMKPAFGRVVGGALEASNFDPMLGLASMIEASRAYQFNATMVQMHDNITGQAISRIARVA